MRGGAGVTGDARSTHSVAATTCEAFRPSHRPGTPGQGSIHATESPGSMRPQIRFMSPMVSEKAMTGTSPRRMSCDWKSRGVASMGRNSTLPTVICAEGSVYAGKPSTVTNASIPRRAKRLRYDATIAPPPMAPRGPAAALDLGSETERVEFRALELVVHLQLSLVGTGPPDRAVELRKWRLDLIVGQVRPPGFDLLGREVERMDDANRRVVCRKFNRLIGKIRQRSVRQRAKGPPHGSRRIVNAPHQAHAKWEENRVLQHPARATAGPASDAG